ncbi:MAG TPA: hypothetical protein PLZ55_11795, partial [bacterium]|nr:hypothetical protein [bacterium]
MKPDFILLYALTLTALTNRGVTAEENPARDVDPAQVVIDTTEEKSATEYHDDVLRTRVSGSLRSEMHLTRSDQVRTVSPGVYARQSLKLFPFYEIIELRADEVGHKGLSFHVQGILALDLGALYFDQRFVADPAYAYVQFQHRGIRLRLGRQMVFSGSTQGLHIDGLLASFQTPIFIGVEALGGLIVSPLQGPDWYANPPADADVDYNSYGRGLTDWSRNGDFAMGARLFYRVSEKVSAGVSYLHLTRSQEVDHALLGFDLDFSLLDWMALTGRTNLELNVGALRDSSVLLDIRPGRAVCVTLDYQHVNPVLFLPAMSIFSVFSDEQFNAFGSAVSIDPLEHLSLRAGYRVMMVGQDVPRAGEWQHEWGMGHQVDADVSIRFGEKEHQGTGRFGYGRVAREGNVIDQLRIGAFIPFGPASLGCAANGYLEFFQLPVNGKNRGIIADAGMFYSTTLIDTGVSVTMGSTPVSELEMRAMLSFAWNFISRFEQAGKLP